MLMGNKSGTDRSVPNAPILNSITPTSDTQMDLGWTRIMGTETDFIVQCSTDGIVFATVYTAAALSIGYTDTGLTPETLYYYRVAARNANGTGRFTNVLSATTQATP